MADNKSKQKKGFIPADAKASFLKSIEKQDSEKSSEKKDDSDKKQKLKASEDKSKASENNKASESENKEEKLFEFKEKTSEEADKGKTEAAEKKNKAEKKPEAKKTVKAKAKLKNGKIPFYSLIPVPMLIQSVLLMILQFLPKEGSSTFIVVSLFWIAVIISGAGMLVLKILYNTAMTEKAGSKSKAAWIYRFLSVINFFRNKTAKITDIVFFIMTVAFVVMISLAATDIYDNRFFCASVISLFMLSLNLHVYFNDSIYEYNNSNNKILDAKDVSENE